MKMYKSCLLFYFWIVEILLQKDILVNGRKNGIRIDLAVKYTEKHRKGNYMEQIWKGSSSNTTFLSSNCGDFE